MRRLREVREAGLSLVELLVSMALLGVVGTLVVSMMIVGQRTSADNQNIVSDSQYAQVAIDAMSRSLRSAVNPLVNVSQSLYTSSNTAGFTITGPNHVTFYTNLQNLSGASGLQTTAPNLIDFNVTVNPKDSTDYQLVETITRPGAGNTYPSSGAIKKVLVDGLMTPSTTKPVFTYYQPVYFSQGSTAELATGNANCSAAVPVATRPTTVSGGTTAWVGANGTTALTDTVNRVVISLTLVKNANGLPFNKHGRTVSVTGTVTLDAANGADFRDGVCL